MDQHLLYFITIVEEGGFSAAAQKLGISQPALSGCVRKLEEKLSLVLFDRSQSPVRLTEVGEAYYRYARQAMQLEESFRSEVRDIEGLNVGRITVGGAVSSNVCYLSRVTAKLCAAYPNVEVRIVDGTVPEMAAMAKNDEIDFFITPEPAQPDCFVYTPLLTERLLLCVPEKWEINRRWQDCRLDPDTLRAPAVLTPTAQEMQEMRFVLLQEDVLVRRLSERIFAALGGRPAHAVTVSQMMTSLDLTVHEAGASFLPESVVRLGNFKVLPALYELGCDGSRRELYLGHKKSHYLSKACCHYMELLRDSFR